eukprot:777717_1
MNDYPNTSANIPNTWSTQGTTSSFNNYTLNTKWSHQNAANQSGSGTPTNPSTLTTTFPSFSGGIPPLYPSISAQSSNSIQGGNNGGGGAPSPFGSQNPSNINPSHSNHHNINNIGGNTTTTTHNHHKSIDKSISQSSSTSSLTALTGPMTKLHINTSYNPYNTAGFTPNDFNNSQTNTPNIPNSNGPTPTGFRFNNYSNPYSNIATPTTPLNATPINKWNTTNALQQHAAMNNLNNNLNAMNMNMNYQLINTVNPNHNVKSANSSFGALPNLSNPSSSNNNNKSSNNDNKDKLTDTSKLNSNAIPYQPSSNTLNNTLTTNALINSKLSNTNIVTQLQHQQLQHQQKAERVPYSYPSYADAVNKINTNININNINNNNNNNNNN